MTDQHQTIKWRYQTPEVEFFDRIRFISLLAGYLSRKPIEGELTSVCLMAKAEIDGIPINKTTYLTRIGLITEVEVVINQYRYWCKSKYDDGHHTESFSLHPPKTLHPPKKGEILPWDRIDADTEDGIILAFLERAKQHIKTKGDTL